VGDHIVTDNAHPDGAMAQPHAQTRRRSLDRRTLQTLVTFSVLVLMCIIFAMLSNRFLTLSNFQNLMRNTAPLIIAGCGMTAVMIARGIDLSVGSILAVTSVLAAALAIAGVPLYLAFALALLFGAFVGLVNGTIIASMQVSAIIVTLGMLNIARGIAYLVSPSALLVGLPPDWSDLGTSKIWIFPMPIIIALAVVAIAHWVTTSSTFGKRIYAIGGNEEAARLSGINIERTLVVLYMLCGFTAALAGLVLSSRVGSGDPNIGVGFELQVIAAVIIGGTSLSGGEGRILGTVIGALIIGVLSNGLNLAGVEPFWQYVAQGVVLIAAVIIDRRVNLGVIKAKRR
jgi:ribose/xylose/arabinose/galactoside ABC-type transport system permease subunit